MLHLSWDNIKDIFVTTGQDDDYYSDTRAMLRHRTDQELGRWGVVICIVSAVFISTGLCLQKLVTRNESNNNSNNRPYYTNSMYIAGLGYVGIGFFLKVFVHAILPLSALAPLSSFTVIFTTILEYAILHVEIDRLSVICLSIVFVGTVLSILGANLIDEEYSFESLRPLFLDQTSLIMSITLFVFVLTCREFAKHTNLIIDHTRNKSNVKMNPNLKKKSDKNNRHSTTAALIGSEIDLNDEVGDEYPHSTNTMTSMSDLVDMANNSRDFIEDHLSEYYGRYILISY